jgi:hypothetical protein
MKSFHNVNFIILFICLLNYYTICDSVCDLELFILELKQDLEDNGILDCLRKIRPPNGVIETTEQKNKRLAAQWDTSCSFESSFDWVSQYKKNFGITTLVDEIGEPVDHNLPDQADMCELFRAGIASGLLDKITTDVTDIPFEALNFIDCPGMTGKKICAVNGDSYFKTDMWTIMIDSMNLQVNGLPSFIKSSENLSETTVIDDPGIPIDRKAIDLASKLIAPSDDEMTNLIASSKEFTKVDKKRPDDPWKRVSILHSTPKVENYQANTGWAFFEGCNVELQTNNDVYVIGYSMISGNAMKSRLAVRLVLDDLSQISTRMIQGYLDYPSMTSGFVSQLQAGTHKLQTQYRASAKLSIDIDNKDTENLISGLVVIPSSSLFMKKIINPMEFQLFNDNNWTDFPNLSTNVKLSTTSYILVMYNLSMPGMQSHIVTKVEINTQSVFVNNLYNNLGK